MFEQKSNFQYSTKEGTMRFNSIRYHFKAPPLDTSISTTVSVQEYKNKERYNRIDRGGNVNRSVKSTDPHPLGQFYKVNN